MHYNGLYEVMVSERLSKLAPRVGNPPWFLGQATINEQCEKINVTWAEAVATIGLQSLLSTVEHHGIECFTMVQSMGG